MRTSSMRPWKNSPHTLLPPIRSAPVDVVIALDGRGRDLDAVDEEPQRRAVVGRGQVRPELTGERGRRRAADVARRRT